MNDKFLHERIYRGSDEIARLASVPITLCGAGALGSLLADNLARQGFSRWKVIDRDRIEEHNVGTQLYGESEVGAWKVEVLRNRLFRAVGVEIEAVAKELTARNAVTLLKGSGVVIDTFDSFASRQLVQDRCRAEGPCVPSCRPLCRLRRGHLGRRLSRPPRRGRRHLRIPPGTEPRAAGGCGRLGIADPVRARWGQSRLVRHAPRSGHPADGGGLGAQGASESVAA